MALNLIDSADIEVNQTGTNIKLDFESTNFNNKVISNNVYSGTETRIGTWYDGKPLYRKVIEFTLGDGSSDYQINLSSLNINKIINVYGAIGTTTGSGGWKPLNFNYAGYSISTRYAYGIMYINYPSVYGNVGSYMVIEYTKTTD